MGQILTVKLKRNGWPEDEAPGYMDEALLAYEEGVTENEFERMEWKEWRLDGKIVKRGGHLTIKPRPPARGILGALGKALKMVLGGIGAASKAAKL